MKSYANPTVTDNCAGTATFAYSFGGLNIYMDKFHFLKTTDNYFVLAKV